MTTASNSNSDVMSAGEWVEAESLIRVPQTPGFIGESVALQAVCGAIARLAPHKSTVLILGESGTGKELVADALHRLGPCPNGPLVRFNCSNVVDGLAESQLFGHVRGAFTDAREAHIGCFRQAQGGTLFLDEIGELPARMQSKMRAVENLEVQPVGSSETFSLDVRLLVATNRDLRAMVAAGEFRADLYYRLDVASIQIPPLRDRLEDTAALAAHFIAYYNHFFGKRVRYISRRALALIGTYGWPGNVRELAHTIERATLLCEHDRIDASDLPPELVEEALARGATLDDPGSIATAGGARYSPIEGKQPVELTLDDVMKAAVTQSLAVARGDCAKAARFLGISRPSIYRKMARYGLRRSGFREWGGVGAKGAPQPD